MHHLIRIVTIGLATSILLVAGAVSAWAQDHDPETAWVVLRTEPPLSDVPFIVNGEEHRTNELGFVSVEMEVRTDQTLAVPEMIPVDATTRYLFARWNDAFEPSRTVRITKPRTYTAGIYIQHKVGFAFLDGIGEPVEKHRIQNARLVNSNGNTFTLSEDAEDEGAPTLDAAWFTANRIRRTGAGLDSKVAEYAFNRVLVNGFNVVQSGAVPYIPEPGATWEVELLLFTLEIDIRSFVFNRPVPATVELRRLGDPAASEPLRFADAEDDLAVVEQLPRGDYEVRVLSGGAAPDTPIIFTGPKTEQITVITRGFFVLLGLAGLFTVAGTYLFVTRPALRVPLVGLAGGFTMILFSVPNIGSVLNRPLSATAMPLYDADGRFYGFEVEVLNEGPTTIAQVYCRPDFELRILGDTSIWTATYESHDFHDVEMGECREHRIGPGTERHILVPKEGQEWVVRPNRPMEAGTYRAFVRMFDVPAEVVTVDIQDGLIGDLIYVTDATLFDEIPFATPFEE